LWDTKVARKRHGLILIGLIDLTPKNTLQ